jgi:hypothetical protein
MAAIVLPSSARLRLQHLGERERCFPCQGVATATVPPLSGA